MLKKKKHRSKSFSRRKKSLSLRRRKQFDILDKKDKQIANLKAEVEHERDRQIANLKAEVEDLKNLLDKFESGQSLRKKRNMLGRKKSRKRSEMMEDSYKNIQERKNMKNKGTLYQKRQTEDRQPEI